MYTKQQKFNALELALKYLEQMKQIPDQTSPEYLALAQNFNEAKRKFDSMFQKV